MYRRGKKQHGDTFSAPRHTGVLRRKLRKRDESRLGFACTEGNKWCHAVEWMCLFSYDPPWYLWKRRKTTISRGARGTILSLRHPLFGFFFLLVSSFSKKQPISIWKKKKKEKKDRSRCQRTKRLETLPTLCFKAIYTLIERRSDARNKAVPSHFWVYTTANGCTCVLFCNKISGSRRSLLVARVEKEEKRRERKWRWSWSISQVQRKEREISLMWFDVKWYFSADRYHLLLHTGCFIYYRLKYLGYNQLHVLCDYSQYTTFRFVSTLLV